MAKKNFTIKVEAEQIVYSNISKSGDGYNSARVVVKRGEGRYMSISYEWKDGDGIPGFAMDLMSFMQSNEMEMAGVVEGREEDYKEYLRENEEEED